MKKVFKKIVKISKKMKIYTPIKTFQINIIIKLIEGMIKYIGIKKATR